MPTTVQVVRAAPVGPTVVQVKRVGSSVQVIRPPAPAPKVLVKLAGPPGVPGAGLVDDAALHTDRAWSSQHTSDQIALNQPVYALRPYLTANLTAGTGVDQAPLITAAMTTLGRGTYQLPPGIVPLDTMLDVPVGCNLVGGGAGLQSANYGTQFLLRTSGACIRFGSPTATAYRNGMSGNFDINGNGVANVCLIVGHVTECQFYPISAHDAVLQGVLLDGTQNSKFMKLDIEYIGTQTGGTAGVGDALVFDHGCQHVDIDKAEITMANGWLCRFTQSSASFNGTINTSNVIKHAVMERVLPGAPGGVLHEAGVDNVIREGGIYLNGSGTANGITYGANAPCTNVRMTQISLAGTPQLSQRLHIDNVSLQGNQTYSTAMKLDANCTLLLQGGGKLLNFLVGFDLAATAYLQILDDPQFGATSITTMYAGANKPSRSPVSGVALTADEAPINNSAALVSSPTLWQTLLPNRLYEFEAVLFYDSDTAADLKIGWTVPTGASGTWTPDGPLTSAASGATGFGIQRPAIDIGATAFVGGTGVGTVVAARVTGTVRTALNGGNLTLQYTQQVATALNTTLRKDSRLVVRLLADSP